MKADYTDVAAITQVIGSVFNNSSILDDTEQYAIQEDDFPEEFHKIVFGSIYNIHMTNSQVSLETITDYLSNRPKYEAVFNQYKGAEYLIEASRAAQAESFNYYYSRLKKFTLLRAYNNLGLDLTSLYDPANILNTKRKQEQEDWLDSTSLVDIAKVIDNMIDDVKRKYVEDDLGAGYQAGDGVEELIAELEKTPEIGIPMYGPLINTVTRGARLRKFYLRSAATGVGKALPNYSKIPTPSGFRKVGDIRPGDLLFGSDGKPTEVLAIHPQKKWKDIWVVKFEDDRIAETCGDHLWEIKRGNEVLVVPTKELRRDDAVPLCAPVEYSEKEYAVAPYCMGRSGRLPQEYMIGSVAQRRELLRGFLDYSGSDRASAIIPVRVTDGYNWLAVQELSWSLGYGTKDLNGIIYIKIGQTHSSIVSVRKTTTQAPMTCFTVAASDHLFLMTDYLVTHNTRSLIADACTFACGKIYDERFGWIKNGTKEPTLFIATEQDKSEVQTMMLAFLSGVNEGHILYGEYAEGEKERVLQAAKLLKESPLWVEELPDFSLQDVENKIKKNVKERGVKYLLSVNEGLCNTFPAHHRGRD